MPRGATPGRNLGEEVQSGYRGAWWWTLRTVDVDGTIKLVGAILRGTPSLPGAACIGRSELFDEIPGQPNRRGVDRDTDSDSDPVSCGLRAVQGRHGQPR